MGSAELVVGFADVGIESRPSVGGKAASLGELSGIGIPVPPGYVVTTAAFETAMRALDPGGAIRRELGRLAPDDHDGVARTTADIRARIEAAPLPGAVSAAVADRYEALGDGACVAVRSSATAEDSADASYAGLQATDLWVRGAGAVADSVRRCWASLYSVESVTYRLRRGLPEEALGTAVVVQHMVDARTAGVMFTRSPTTGDRSVVVLEACWGLGSALVSGDVTPDRFVVSKVTGEIVGRTVSSKGCQHRRNPGGAGVGEAEVPAAMRATPCLNDEEIRELARLGRRIEGHYGTPQDIEWALGSSAEGTDIFVVQSRPETAWSRRRDAPVAAPKSRAYDHVIDRMLGGSASFTGGSS